MAKIVSNSYRMTSSDASAGSSDSTAMMSSRAPFMVFPLSRQPGVIVRVDGIDSARGVGEPLHVVRRRLRLARRLHRRRVRLLAGVVPDHLGPLPVDHPI